MHGGDDRSRASAGAARWTDWARRAVGRGAAGLATQPARAQASGAEWAAGEKRLGPRRVRASPRGARRVSGTGPVGGVALGHAQAGGAGNRGQGCMVLGRGGGGGWAAAGRAGEGAGLGQQSSSGPRASRGRGRAREVGRGGTLGRGWAKGGFFSFCFSSFSISPLFYFPTIKFIYNK
jgi:hypothetical protein